MPFGTLAASSVAIAVAAGALYAGPVFRAALVADLGWSNELAAGAFAVGYLAAGTTPIVSGVVADRFGAPRLLVAGLLLSALGLFGAAWTSAPWHWYLAAGVALSVAYHLVHIGGTLIATSGSARGTAVGVAIGLGAGLGLAAGPVLAPLLIDVHGRRAALGLFGVGALTVAVLVAWWIGRRDNLARPSPVEASAGEPGVTPGPGAAGTPTGGGCWSASSSATPCWPCSTRRSTSTATASAWRLASPRKRRPGRLGWPRWG